MAAPTQLAYASIGHVVATLHIQNVFELGFSPFGTFIITWQRPSKEENGDAVKNLTVWRVVGGDSFAGHSKHMVVGRFVQKSASGWILQYTQDERFCARIVTNEVHLYESVDLATVWNKVRVEGVTNFAISPGEDHAIAVFVPERKGLPAAVEVFRVPNFDAPILRKNFFKGDKVQLKWNKDGTSLVALAQTEVDKSGKNYYGETTLYLMSVKDGFDSRIDLDKDGPIHDVTWSPNSKEFGVVYGYMPAKATLFDTRANTIHTFPLRPRNTILFSPHGRHVLIAGFGNLAGQMDVYDLKKNNTKICTIEASNASVCEWSPDGKHILTATTSPRLRVDNGVRIWHISGGLMYNEDLQELYHVTWRPQTTTQDLLEDPLRLIPTPHASALSYLGTVKTPSKPAGAYRPPGARGQVTPLAFKREDEGGAAYVSSGSLSQGINISSFGKSRRREVPGAENSAVDTGAAMTAVGADDENLSKTAAKNKKKREAKKAKDAAEKAGGLVSTVERATDGKVSSPSPDQERRDEKAYDSKVLEDNGVSQTKLQIRLQSSAQVERQPAAKEASQPLPMNGTTKRMPPAEAPAFTVTSPGSGGSSHEKKVRALLKKLRAIDDLKMRRAGGEKLEGTQVKKMDTENAVRKELDDLGWND
ncbi:MAG: hypothetical protein Q9164_006041 [Protoblastenia rupestris]